MGEETHSYCSVFISTMIQFCFTIMKCLRGTLLFQAIPQRAGIYVTCTGLLSHLPPWPFVSLVSHVMKYSLSTFLLPTLHPKYYSQISSLPPLRVPVGSDTSISLHVFDLSVMELALLLPSESFPLWLCACWLYYCCTFQPCMHHGYNDFFIIFYSRPCKQLLYFFARLYIALCSICVSLATNYPIHFLPGPFL